MMLQNQNKLVNWLLVFVAFCPAVNKTKRGDNFNVQNFRFQMENVEWHDCPMYVWSSLCPCFAPNTSDSAFYCSLVHTWKELVNCIYMIGVDMNSALDPHMDNSTQTNDSATQKINHSLIDVRIIYYPSWKQFIFTQEGISHVQE